MKKPVITILLLVSGCSKTVDCDKLKEKMLGCKADFDAVYSTEKKSVGNYSHLLDEVVIEPCRSRKGDFGDARRINSCLRIKDCDAFVRCFFRTAKKGKRESK
ncbi:MAG: hypothetical protein JXR95_14815 [Deltaproteobacteria bacterium]|nr:hypothetical protein [Deltaproteobacteria bacterium]